MTRRSTAFVNNADEEYLVQTLIRLILGMTNRP